MGRSFTPLGFQKLAAFVQRVDVDSDIDFDETQSINRNQNPLFEQLRP